MEVVMSPEAREQLIKRAEEVQQRYTNYLMSKANVVGVGIGFAFINGIPTEDVAVVVMVDHKLAPDEIAPEDRIPSRLEGVRVDVQETGMFGAFGDAGSADAGAAFSAH
jgi:hypothetical protein